MAMIVAAPAVRATAAANRPVGPQPPVTFLHHFFESTALFRGEDAFKLATNFLTQFTHLFTPLRGHVFPDSGLGGHHRCTFDQPLGFDFLALPQVEFLFHQVDHCIQELVGTIHALFFRQGFPLLSPLIDGLFPCGGILFVQRHQVVGIFISFAPQVTEPGEIRQREYSRSCQQDNRSGQCDLVTVSVGV
ncbi:MAG: hypothetical protein HUU36_15570 [Candidatus Omnitrophica bacterium]|nr:hypothetical protein [Candidatus Omnitrophota bacterium]